MGLLDTLTILFIQLFGGISSPVSKFALTVVPPVTYVFLRLCLSGVLLLPFVRRIPKRDFKILLRIGVVLYVCSYACAFLGLQRMEIGTFIVLFQMQVPFSMFMGWLLFREKITPAQIGGCLVAFAGIVVLFGVPKIAAQIAGVPFVLAAAAANTFATLDMKRLKGISFAALTVFPILTALPFLFLLTRFIEPAGIVNISRAGIPVLMGALSYHVFLGPLTQLWWQRLVTKHGVAATAPWQLLMPIFGIIGGVVFFHETLGPQQIIGTVLVIGGLAVAQFAPRIRIRHG